MKPGYKTSELYVMILAIVLSLAVSAGWLTAEESRTVENAAGQMWTAVERLVMALGPLVGAMVYTWSRTRLKK